MLFRLDPGTSPFPSLELRTEHGPTASTGNALCESSELTSCLESDGTVTHLLRMRLRNWGGPHFELEVPSEVTVLAARLDGSWLGRLDASVASGKTRVILPIVSGATVQEIALLYTSNGTRAWPLMQAVSAPMPRVPQPGMEPLIQRRFWRWPAGWEAHDTSRWRRRGQPEGLLNHATLPALADRVWHAGAGLIARWDPTSAAWTEAQQTDLDAAEAKLRSELSAGTTLGEAFERLAVALKDVMPIIVDAEGLRAAGKGPLTKLPPASAGKPFWDALGLVYVPCPSGPLMTTRERRAQGQRQTGSVALLAERLDAAIAEAAALGMDHAGCFVAANHWQGTAATGAVVQRSAEATRALELFSPVPGPGRTEWEPLPGLSADDSVVLWHAPALRILGYVLAGAWFLVATWFGWRASASRFFRVHLVAASLLVLAVLWLPGLLRDRIALPLLLSELAAFALTFTARAWPGQAKQRLSRSTMVRTAAAATVLMAATVALPVPAQMPPPPEQPYAVYLVRGVEPDTEFAFAGLDLLKKLDEMAGRSAAPAGAIVVGARYQGKVKDGAAEIHAEFNLHQFAETSALVLPLTGVQLQSGVFLDGVPVFPVAHNNGYELRELRGKGGHRLTLTFQVRAVLVNDYHELRFGIPKTGPCQLDLDWVGPVRGLHLMNGLGEEKIRLDKEGATLRAQLGYEEKGLVRVRWSTNAPVASPPAIEVREAYYWDLRPATLGLTAAVEFKAPRASVNQVRFGLPEGLEVRKVELTKAAAGSALRQWEVIGPTANRQLTVDFVQPVSGTIGLVIEFVPRLSLAPGPWLLRLPVPRLGKDPENASDGLLAYRLEGVDAEPSPQNLSVLTASAQLFGKAWMDLTGNAPPPLSRAVTFRRPKGNPPAALSLAVQRVLPTAKVDVHWNVGPRDANLAAQVQVSSNAEDLVLVELELPPRCKLVRLTEVGGTHVHHWSRQDRVVQVWLQQPRKQISLSLRGWVEHAKLGATSRFELAPLRVPNARSLGDVIDIEPSPGVALTTDRLLNLTRTRKANPTQFTADDGRYEASFTLKPVQMRGVARAFTVVERRGESVELTTALHLPPHAGEVHVAVTGWNGGDDLQLDVPAPVLRKAYQRQGARHSWTLVLPPGLPETVTLRLQGRLSADRLRERWSMPRIELDPPILQDQAVALSGVEPVGKHVPELQVVPPTRTGFPSPPRELRSGSRVGWLKDASGGLALHIPPTSTSNSPQVLRAEQDAFWGGAGWVHQLRVLAFCPGQGELRVRLSETARCRALAVDQRVTVPDDRVLRIGLDGAPGPRLIQVCWTYDGESPGSPRLERAVLEAQEGVAVPMRLWLPLAFNLAAMPSDLAERSAESALTEAEAQMRLCALWAAARPSTEVLAQAQQVFRGFIEHAGVQIAQLNRDEELGSAANLAQRRLQLVDENSRLAKAGGYASATRQTRIAPRTPALLPCSGNGMPLWLSPRNAQSALVSMQELEEASARAGVQLLLLTAIALLLLSYLRRGLVLLGALWPEMLLALALFGIYLGGASLVGIGLVVFAVALRALWLGLYLRRVFSAWFAGPAQSASSDRAQAPPASA
jgi:hypothetical protein